jgi:hypothetical protein
MIWFYSVFIFNLLSSVHADEWVPLSRIQTHYVLPKDETLPSCQIFKHRRLEREKVLREIKHSLKDNVIVTMDLFLKDQYIINKLFLESHLWRDQVVTIVSTWKVPPALSEELKTKGSETFLRLAGDGIQWQEKMAFFPEEVKFFWDENQQILETHHQTYYVDYCNPQTESELSWLRAQEQQPQLSTQVQLDQFLQLIKEI